MQILGSLNVQGSLIEEQQIQAKSKLDHAIVKITKDILREIALLKEISFDQFLHTYIYPAEFLFLQEETRIYEFSQIMITVIYQKVNSYSLFKIGFELLEEAINANENKSASLEASALKKKFIATIAQNSIKKVILDLDRLSPKLIDYFNKENQHTLR